MTDPTPIVRLIAETEFPVLRRKDAQIAAETYLRNREEVNGKRVLLHYRAQFYRWNGWRYAVMEKGWLEDRLWIYLEGFRYLKGESEAVPLVLTRNFVGDVVASVKSIVRIDKEVTLPFWRGENPFPDGYLISFNNGILHVTSGEMRENTPNYINVKGFDCDYDETAQCPIALAAEDDWFGDDIDARNAFEEACGSSLVGDNKHQKMFIFYGPTGAGKSAAAAAIRVVLGNENVTAASLKSIDGDFGLESWLNKMAVIFGDVRVSSGRQIDIQSVLSTLLSISGGDLIDINRKGLPSVQALLDIVIYYLTNEIPSFPDQEGAFLRRLLIIAFRDRLKYGYDAGRQAIEERKKVSPIIPAPPPDQEFLAYLRSERAGLINLYLEAYRRYSKRGYFIQPASRLETLKEVKEKGDLYVQFIEDCIIFEKEASVKTREVTSSEVRWRKFHRYPPKRGSWIGRTLKKWHPEVELVRTSGGYNDYYKGMRLRTEGEGGIPETWGLLLVDPEIFRGDARGENEAE